MKKFKAKTKVEIIRRGLALLKDSVEKEALRNAYRNASLQTRGEALEIDEFLNEGLK